MKKTILLLLMMGVAHASLTLPAGTCQDFLLFNQTDNSTYTQAICAENATIVQNVTVVENYTCPEVSLTMWANSSRYINNVTISCLQNVSTVYQNVSFCPAANLTIWANSTSEFAGNGTVTCLGNTTVVQNVVNYTCPQVSLIMWANSTREVNNATISCLQNVSVPSPVCNFTAAVYPSTSEQRLQNVSGLDLTFKPIPPDYCFENRFERASTTTVWRSDKANDTFICEPSACAGQQACPVCQAAPECPAQNVTPDNETVLALASLNDSIYGAGGWAQKLQASQDAYGLLNSTCGSISSTVKSEVQQEVGGQVGDVKGTQEGINTTIEYALLAILAGGLFFVFKSRMNPPASKYGRAVSQEEVNKVLNDAKGGAGQ